MTALVAPLQPLGGHSFGGYLRQHQDNDENDDQVEERSDTSANAENETSPLSASADTSDWSNVGEINDKNDDDASMPFPLDGMPRSRYSLDEDEPTTNCQAPAIETFAEIDVPNLSTNSNDSDDEYVMVDNVSRSNEDVDVDVDSLPSLNDMDDKPEDSLLPPFGTPTPRENSQDLFDKDILKETGNDAFGIDFPMVPPTETAVTTIPPSLPFGGLHNMGNTCYLNSALQMITSLDEFSSQIKKHVPATEVASSENGETMVETLRQSLLNVLERLDRGEIFRPEAFKSKVDERSPLFIGYQQQDAHEFLTTLLDLLDEDYKEKVAAEEEDEEMNDAASTKFVEDEKVEAASHLESLDKHQQEDDQQAYDPELPVKKQRLEEGSDLRSKDVPVPSRSGSQSFKSLEFEDIENLLHGNDESSAQANNDPNSRSRGEGPKCKLVGGRTNHSGANLTRWQENKNVALPFAGSKSTGQETNLQTEEETKPFSPVDDYFTTEVRVCLTCDSCKYRRSHTETYLHLSLEIGPAIGNIEEGLRAFFKPEKRDIKCEKCFFETAMQTTEITKLPRALLFHLKRFIVDVSPDYTSISYRKDQSPVAYEPHLEVDEHVGVLGEVVADDVLLPSNARYCLRSIVNHIGNSASCGHYTADACRMDKEGREWIRCNDSHLSKVSQADALQHATSTGYMVMYELEQSAQQD